MEEEVPKDCRCTWWFAQRLLMVSRKIVGPLNQHEKQCLAALVKRHREKFDDVDVLQVRHKQGRRPLAFVCTLVQFPLQGP